MHEKSQRLRLKLHRQKQRQKRMTMTRMLERKRLKVQHLSRPRLPPRK
jgi:hypothetical protein